uniref:Fibronectin type III domain containing 3B n=1 Tax=Cavia porcellus TaxID=10141 RepID=A0A286XEZ8_CAVPO
MYVTMMMTDQIPLELPPLLNGEVAMMPHLVNGEAAQQVILVQVNPGETFTIRAEDGTLQCIQEYELEVKRVQDILSGIEKPQVSNIQARTVVLSWAPPVGLSCGPHSGLSFPYSYEVAL